MAGSFKEGFCRWRGNPALALLLWGFFLCAGTLIFIKFASEVREGETLVLDELILRSLRNPSDLSDPIGPPRFENAMSNLTALGSPAVLLLFMTMAAGFLIVSRRFYDVALLVASGVGGMILTVYLQRFFDRPRPSVVSHWDIVTTASFPSGHTLLATIVYCSIGAVCAGITREAKTKILLATSALFLSFCVGFTRVYLGVHYPTDILAGWAVGIAWTVLCWEAFNRLRGK